MTIGWGCTTFQRPEFLEKVGKAFVKQCANVVDRVVIYNDGSDAKFNGAYKRAYKPFESIGATIIDAPVNRGNPAAKNAIIDALILDCDWIILAEDDVKPVSPKAITEYVRICQDSGTHHLSFAHHGEANLNVPLGDSDITYFPHSMGAWTIFSAECLKAVGGLDEAFRNAWMDVEHELRLIQAGYAPGADAYCYPDATHSQEWIVEIPGSFQKSPIRGDPKWSQNIRDGLIYWKSAKPDTYDMVFGPDKPLYAYAERIIA